MAWASAPLDFHCEISDSVGLKPPRLSRDSLVPPGPSRARPQFSGVQGFQGEQYLQVYKRDLEMGIN